ncbi:MAG: TonB-dependent receptor [Planctomycetes bacterium]|nr:TonB-dependent receptor [Planctomycetota bacterium]
MIQYLPGASVKVLARNYPNWGAYGGIGPKYCTYMVQGLPVDALIDPMIIDALALQRIEVQRGPASVLYPNYLFQDFAGNQSPLAGTVNLILKDHFTEPRTMVSLDYGSYKTFSGHAYHENSFKRFHVMGGVSVERSDYTDYGSKGSWLNMKKDPEYIKGKGFLGTKFYLDEEEKHNITLFGNQTLHRGDEGRTFREYDRKYSLLNTGYTGRLTDNLELAFKTGVRWYDHERQSDEYDSASSAFKLEKTSSSKQLIVPVDLSLMFNHLKNSNLTVGVDYQNASYETMTRLVNGNKKTNNDASVSQMGIYLQEEMQLDKFTLRGGGRFNFINYTISKIGGQPPGEENRSWKVGLWSAGVKYRLSKEVIFFTNAGNSFMSPSLKSIGGTIQLSDKGVAGKNGQLPNPDLDPENGIGVDLGFDYLLPVNLCLSTRAFYTIITDAIMDIVISEDPSQTQSVNTDGNTVGMGFEFSVRQQVAEKIDWFVNITYTHSEIESPENPDEDGAEVPFVPAMMQNIGFTVYLPWDITISPMAHFGGRIFDSNSKSDRSSYDSGEQLNMLISKTFNFSEERNLNLFVKLYNLTNNKYEMPWAFQDPGFSFQAGARVVF